MREQELFKSVVIGNTMKNRIKRNTKRIKKLQEGKNFKQKETHSQTLDTEGHLGKGSKRRPQVVSDKDFQDAWDKIFPRKVTPKHGQSQVHRDKTKYNRKVSKTELLKDDSL